MFNIHARLAMLLVLIAVLLANPANASLVKGIYLTQSTLENTAYLTYLVTHAKKVGISTFIVDLVRPSKKYQENINLLKTNSINYVARIVVFPDGGATPDEVNDQNYWEKRYELIKSALSYGASEIQLDYIRYNTEQPASHTNSERILSIIQWFKDRLTSQNIPLQIDVFGISSFGEAKHIGQNIKLFSQAIDVLCPMVYPSHYEPFLEHAAQPYQTVFHSLSAIKAQFNRNVPFKLMPYIEMSNYHYPLSREKKLSYIYAQIQAAENAGADGWYAWSAHNRYDVLFQVLETYPVK